jgi:hypothetical protein
VAADLRWAADGGGWCGEAPRERVAAAGDPAGGDGGGLRSCGGGERSGGWGEEDVDGPMPILSSMQVSVP